MKTCNDKPIKNFHENKFVNILLTLNYHNDTNDDLKKA